MTKQFDRFKFSQLFEEILPVVLAHLDPELELFEVEDIGSDGDNDLWHHYTQT